MQKQVYALQPTARLQNWRERLQHIQQSLMTVMTHRVRSHREHLDTMISHLRSIDPKNLLQRGYSILFAEKDGSVINSVHKLNVGTSFKLMVADGKAFATTKEIIES